MLDAGFGLLERLIEAKAEEAAHLVVRVDPRFTSQECSLRAHLGEKSPEKALRALRVIFRAMPV
jgi:transposase